MVPTIEVIYMAAGKGFWRSIQIEVCWDPSAVLIVELAWPEGSQTGGGAIPVMEQLNETSERAFWSSGTRVELVGLPATRSGKVSPAMKRLRNWSRASGSVGWSQNWAGTRAGTPGARVRFWNTNSPNT